MFHQIEIPTEDHNFLCFLWWEDGNLNKEPQEYQMKVYIFGAVCSPSCANFTLCKTTEDNQVHGAVLNNFYVVDYERKDCDVD